MSIFTGYVAAGAVVLFGVGCVSMMRSSSGCQHQTIIKQELPGVKLEDVELMQKAAQNFMNKQVIEYNSLIERGFSHHQIHVNEVDVKVVSNRDIMILNLEKDFPLLLFKKKTMNETVTEEYSSAYDHDTYVFDITWPIISIGIKGGEKI